MSKSNDHYKTLQRALNRLARLDGTLLPCLEGPHLVFPEAVADARPLLEACIRHGVPTLDALRRGLRMGRDPLALSARTLASAHRDLLQLEANPRLLQQIREAPRLFRGHEEIDPAWLEARRRQLEAISARLASPPALPAAPSCPVRKETLPPDAPDHFAAVLELIRALRGDAQVLALLRIAARTGHPGRERRREVRRRLEALAHRLESPRSRGRSGTPLDLFLDDMARRMEGLDGLPGRARARRFRQLLRTVTTWPTPDAGHEGSAAWGPPSIPPGGWPARVRASIPEVLDRLGLPDDAAYRARLFEVLALYGLMFRVDPEVPPVLPSDHGAAPAPASPTPALSPDEVDRAIEELDTTLHALAGRPLTLGQVCWLQRLPVLPWQLPRLAAWVTDGLEPAVVDPVVALGRLKALLELEGPVEAARAFCRWITRLVPHYRALGIELELEAKLFAALGGGRNGDPGVLVHCLIQHHARPTAARIEHELATLDATLALFDRLPVQARGLLEELSATPPGLGRATFPAFADWLEEDSLLDRFCHLSRLAGETPTLSAALQTDFTRETRMAGQRAWLEALAAPTDAQRRRLELLRHATPPTPARTRRRLADRLPDLLARAYQRRLEALLRGLLREAFDITLPALTPAWRDAVRFYLLVEENRGLLGTLLRYAAAHPGRSIARALAPNRAWLERIDDRLDVEAWLRPRRSTLELDGRRYTLALEEDPLEVLRMGIPFDTCLSLLDGCNAAATVLNALDANKRVIYLRDERGSIVARKLVAVSSDLRLVGYRLYLALEGPHEPAVAAAVHRLCVELAGETGLELASTGVPERLHDGFWYDDGTEPFEGGGGLPELEAWCRTLGRPVPTYPPQWLIQQARSWHAHRTGDLEAAIASLTVWDAPVTVAELGDWIVERLGEREVLRRAVEDGRLVQPLLHASRHHPVHLMRQAGALAMHPRQVRYALDFVAHHLPSPHIAEAWLEAAERGTGQGRAPDDEGIEHGTLFHLAEHLRLRPVAGLLDDCDRLEPIWSWLIEGMDWCRNCRLSGTGLLLTAAEEAYQRQPAPKVVLECLRDRRRSPLAHRVALRLAACFPLPAHPPKGRSVGGECAAPGPGWRSTLLERLERPVSRSPAALQALRELRRIRPELEAEPDLLAAMVRQAAPGTDGEWQALEPLPVPAQPPFEALGDLILKLDGLERVLARWTPVDPDGWKPGRWELEHHRRTPTRWRRRLERLAGTEEDGAGAAARWLQALETSEEVDRPGPTRSDIPVSPEVTRLALRVLRDGGRIPEALELLIDAELEPPFFAEIIERLLDPALPLEEATRDDLISRALSAAPIRRAGLPPALVARLWQREASRDALLELLIEAHRYAVHPTLSRIEAAARRLDPPCSVAGLWEAWAARMVERRVEIDGLSQSTDRERLERLCRAVLALEDPDGWIELYRALWDASVQAFFLDRLAEKPVEVRAALQERLEPDAWDGDARFLRQWLEEVLTGG